MRFAQLLKKCRLRTRMTQAKFAASLGISVDSYTAWEQGLYLPSFKNLDKLISRREIFGTDCGKLLDAYTSDKTHFDAAYVLHGRFNKPRRRFKHGKG